MRVHRTALLLFLLFLVHVNGACAQVVVIVNGNNPVTHLSRSQLIDLYMGRRLNFPGGAPALPLDQASGSPLRQRFYQALVGKSEAKVNAYWARLLFSGITSPPRVLPTVAATMQVVRENTAAIAYVDATDATEGVERKQIKIVFSFATDNR